MILSVSTIVLTNVRVSFFLSSGRLIEIEVGLAGVLFRADWNFRTTSGGPVNSILILPDLLT